MYYPWAVPMNLVVYSHNDLYILVIAHCACQGFSSLLSLCLYLTAKGQDNFTGVTLHITYIR